MAGTHGLLSRKLAQASGKDPIASRYRPAVSKKLRTWG